MAVDYSFTDKNMLHQIMNIYEAQLRILNTLE